MKENKRKENFLSRDPILERAKDSSNTTMGFIDTSVGLIDVSMVRIILGYYSDR